MRPYLAVMAVFAVLIGAAAAAETAGNGDVGQLLQSGDIDAAVDIYNQNADRVPGAIAIFVRDETVNVKINHSEDQYVYGIKLRGMTVVNHTAGGFDDWSVTVATDIQTIKDITAAKHPPKRAVKEFTSGDITYETRGLVATVKYGILNVGLSLFGFLL